MATFKYTVQFGKRQKVQYINVPDEELVMPPSLAKAGVTQEEYAESVKRRMIIETVAERFKFVEEVNVDGRQSKSYRKNTAS